MEGHYIFYNKYGVYAGKLAVYQVTVHTESTIIIPLEKDKVILASGKRK